MKTRGAGAFTITLIMILIAGTLLAKAVGADEWILATLTGVAQSFRIATGWNPLAIFSNTSLSGEFRTYGEVLASHYYLQVYFAGGGICAVLSVVFILRANAVQLWKHHAAFVAFLILLLLPIALTTVTYGEVLATRSISYFCLAVLLLLGFGTCVEILRVKANGAGNKLMQTVTLMAVVVQGVVVPLMYGAKFIFTA